MGCATGIVKFLMFLFNFVFVVGGVLLITFGVMALTGYQDFQQEYEHVVKVDSFKAPPIILIVVGGAVFLIAFMGCCGVLRENNCMMMTYAVFLTIILLVQVGIAVAAALYEDEFKEVLQKGMSKSIEKYSTADEVKKTWDAMQSNLHCCGSDSYNDWSKTGHVPESCCLKQAPGCSDGVLGSPDKAETTIYTEGCVNKILSDVKIKYVVYTAAVIAGVELLGIVFACCLAARFRRKNYA
ncbi:CD63 antigen [Orchesella cincta]|uniref:Tetraspanin n=1 Tax=Orchesella cincta TaxID=48709 RepID=A0A1D2MQE5_ORCCI|nr:CD63 antigen [Orchesella cincta]